MITIATLHTATPQQVFDQAVTHLRSQGVAAKNETHECMYRTPNGLKCAAGCFIADSEYRKTMENTPWSAFGPESHKDLIKALQHCHDDNTPSEWESEFERIAQKYKLDYSKQ